MDPVCLLLAGALVGTLAEPDFTVSWTHSVAKTRWVESYRVDGTVLRLVEASVEGSAAGMEPGPDAVLQDGRWRWRPQRTLASLALSRSRFAPDYTICTASGCRELGAIAAVPEDGSPMVIRPCAAAES